MRYTIIFMSLALLSCLCQSASFAHHGGGSQIGGGGPHGGWGPPVPMQMPAPLQVSRPPFQQSGAPQSDHFQTPQLQRFAAPQVEQFRAPRAERFAAPRVEQFRAPRAERFAAPQAERFYTARPERVTAPLPRQFPASPAKHFATQRPEHAPFVHAIPLASLSPGKARVHKQAEGGENTGATRRQLALLAGAESEAVIPRPPEHANPRQVPKIRPGMMPQFVRGKPQPLSWRHGANIPRSGPAGIGRPGIVDPGGYIRTPLRHTTGINYSYVKQQRTLIPNLNLAITQNNRLRITNVHRWPHPLRPGPAWAPLAFYTGYWWGSIVHPIRYFAPLDFCPTRYVFLVGCGQFWQPGFGYAAYLPYGYQAPITVAVQEIVPVYDEFGDIVAYEPATFYYNAYWDSVVQAYAYYDYRGVCHWLTFPWLRTWSWIS